MKTVLIVEDEYDVRVNLKELLESEFYNVIIAEDGVVGYQLATQKRPDLIISDIKMPHLDGFELFKMLQESPATDTIPFIFLTAKVDISDFREGMSLGADDYLTKPFKIDDVLKAVEARLKKKENINPNFELLNENMLRKIPHELRTPLVGIIGFSQLIEENVEDFSKDQVKEMVNKIHKSGKRLQRRIEKFLCYAEMLAEEKPAIGSNLNDNISYNVDQSMVKYKLNSLLNDFGRTEDFDINVDNAQIKINERYFEIILRELVENALKFSPRGSTVKIDGRINDHFYKTKIEDSGCGMTEKTLKNISTLDQFASDKYQEEGVGLGLVLVQKIISLSKGYIKVNSKLNEKTIVEFGIPLMGGE